MRSTIILVRLNIKLTLSVSVLHLHTLGAKQAISHCFAINQSACSACKEQRCDGLGLNERGSSRARAEFITFPGQHHFGESTSFHRLYHHEIVIALYHQRVPRPPSDVNCSAL